MHCDHKRVWEMTNSHPDVNQEFLRAGWEPFAVVYADVRRVYFKRLTPCQECMKGKLAEVGDTFLIRGQECVVTRVFKGGFEYHEKRYCKLTYTNGTEFLPKAT